MSNEAYMAINVSLDWNAKLLIPLKDAQLFLDILLNTQLLKDEKVEPLPTNTISLNFISPDTYAELKLKSVINPS